MSHRSGIILLAIRGSLSPRTVDEARRIHNETAGHPEGVAAAKALGDLSHNVYVPVDSGEAASELLILDLWNDPAGLQKFFSNPQVQEQGGRIFASRDPVVWAPAEDTAGFTLPSPRGKDERYVGLLRATARSRSAAAEAFDAIVRTSTNVARRAGQSSHHVYFRMTPPGEPASLELLGVDTWMDAAGMKDFYASGGHLAPLKDAFAGPPIASTWKQPAGSWVEW